MQNWIPIAMGLLLIQSLMAAEIQASGRLESNGWMQLQLKIENADLAGKELVLEVPGVLRDVTARDRSGLELETRIETSGNLSRLKVRVPVDYVQLEFRSDSWTSKNGSEWRMDLPLHFSESLASFDMSIDMPSGATLTRGNGEVSGNGDMLQLRWHAENITMNERLRFRASYQLPEQKALDANLVLALAIFLVAGAFLAYRWVVAPSPVRSKENHLAVPATLASETNPLFQTLDENDKEIIREVLRQRGKTTQVHLYLHTHIPKATLSRRIASLVNRGILQKSHKGNRNLITLTERLKTSSSAWVGIPA